VDGLGRLSDVVVVHFPMARRVPEHAVAARKQRSSSLLLTSDGRGICQRPIGAESLVHQVDTGYVFSEAADRADAGLYGFHGGEDALLVLADQELRSRFGFGKRVDPPATALWRRTLPGRPG